MEFNRRAKDFPDPSLFNPCVGDARFELRESADVMA